MLLIEYPKCATCQKAAKWLEKNGFSFERRHIKEQNPTREELKLWYEKKRIANQAVFQYQRPFLSKKKKWGLRISFLP